MTPAALHLLAVVRRHEPASLRRLCRAPAPDPLASLAELWALRLVRPLDSRCWLATQAGREVSL